MESISPMRNDATYWQIRHKADHSRNVWVSGVTGLCDLPEGAMKLAVGCKEIALEDAGNWDIIQCPSWEDIQERIANSKKFNFLVELFDQYTTI